MRHLKFSLALAAAVLTVFSGAAAFAGVAGSPHDVSVLLTKSVCEPCHLPHGATGDRLWATTKSSGGTGWNTLTISQLCGSCHYGTNAYGALITPNDMTNYAYNGSNHGYQASNLALRSSFDNAALGASGLPYTNQANIQCSSCHNPHENTVRPFMRLASGTVETMCLLCHARNNGDGSTALYGAANSVNGFSQHPVNIGYTAGGSAGNPGLKAFDAALFGTSRGTTSQGDISVTDALGGKLLGADGTTGNMGCPTCHQVHGDGSTAVRNAWLLVTGNQISTGTPTTAALCEACHTGGAPGGTVLVGSSKDHPIDNVLSGRAAHFDFTPWASSNAYESQDVTWPENGSASPYWAGCTSCHSAHYGLAGSPMQRSYAQTGGSPFNPTPTADLHNSTQWCNSCHTAASKAPYGHHSNKDNYASSLINCGDCHAGGTPDTTIAVGQFSAHRNWAGLDLPASPNPVNGERGNFCLKCHAGTAFTPLGGSSTTGGMMTAQANVPNPTNGYLAVLPAQHGTKRTAGGGQASSHYVGTTARLAAPDNITAPRTLAWESGFFSVYADSNGAIKGTATAGGYGSFAASDRVICESCHNIMYNVGAAGNTNGITAASNTGYANNLLLDRFEDDAAGTTGGTGSATGSLLCVGCHIGNNVARASLVLNTNKPAGTHPVTGSTVTKAADIARSPVTLITATTGYANASSAPGIQSYVGTDAMDCDSCHRAHDGAQYSASASFNYILEQATATNNVQSMCTQCHTY